MFITTLKNILIWWFAVGILFSIITTYMGKKKNLYASEDFSTITGAYILIIVLGPPVLSYMYYLNIQHKKEVRINKRKNASWWELKEYGGKY